MRRLWLKRCLPTCLKNDCSSLEEESQNSEIKDELVGATALITLIRKVFAEEQASVTLAQKQVVIAIGGIDPGQPIR